MKITTKYLALIFLMGILSFTSLSQEWNGSESNDWFDPLNWTPSEVPSTGDNVVIPVVLGDFPEIDGNVTIQDLEIAASATITLLPSNTLTITGTLSGDGEIQTIATACLILDDSGADLIYQAEEIPNEPTGNASQEFCQGATVEDLEATGDNIQWYDDPSSTTPLDLTDELDDNTAYYATQTVNGCESTDRLEVQVTILPNATGEETYTGCADDGYEVIVNGTTYDETNPTGTETFVGQAANGCDSIVTINLNFLSEITGTDVVTACGSFEWIDGTVYTESNNTATFTLPSVNGCDSVVTLNLTIQNELTTSVSQVVNSNGMLVLISDQASASYQWLDCDNGFAPIQNANNRTFVPQVNGNYAVKLSSGLCVDTSDCVNINDLSTSESELASSIKVYPNPTNDVITVQTNGLEGSIEVVDALGRFISSSAIESKNTVLDLSKNNKGVYLLRVIQNNEAQTIREVLN